MPHHHQQQQQQQQHPPLQSPAPPRSFNTYDPLASLPHHHHHHHRRPHHPHNALASDQELLSDFCSFLELCVLTKNIELLRRIVLEFLVHQELTLVHFKRFGANLVAILPFAVVDAHKHACAVQLLHKPRPSSSATCARVFAFLAARVATKNLETLERVFRDFCNRSDAALETFVKLGTQAVSIIPCDPVLPLAPVFAPTAYSASHPAYPCYTPHLHHVPHAQGPPFAPPQQQQQPPPPSQLQSGDAAAPGVTPTHERAKRMASSQSKPPGLSDRAPIARRRTAPAPAPRAGAKRRAVRKRVAREPSDSDSDGSDHNSDSDDEDNDDGGDKRRRRAPTKRRRIRASRGSSLLVSSGTTDKSTVDSMIDETIRLMNESTKEPDPAAGSQSVPHTGRKPVFERTTPTTELQQLKTRIRDALRVHEAREPWRRAFYKLPLPFDEENAPGVATKLRAFWRLHGRAVWERNFWAPLDLTASAKRSARQRLARVAFEAITLDVYHAFGPEVFVALDAEPHPGWWYRGPILDVFAYCRVVGEAKCLAFVKANLHERFPDCGFALPLKSPNYGVLRAHTLESAAVWPRTEEAAAIVQALSALKHKRAANDQTSVSAALSDVALDESETRAPVVEANARASVDGAVASSSANEAKQEEQEEEQEPEEQPPPPIMTEGKVAELEPAGQAELGSSRDEDGDAGAASTEFTVSDGSLEGATGAQVEDTGSSSDTKDTDASTEGSKSGDASTDEGASSADVSGAKSPASDNDNEDDLTNGVDGDDNEDEDEERLIEAMALESEVVETAAATSDANVAPPPAAALDSVAPVRPGAPVQAAAPAPAIVPTTTTAMAMAPAATATATAAPPKTCAAAATAAVADAAQAAAAAVAGLEKDLAPERFAALMRKINARGLK